MNRGQAPVHSIVDRLVGVYRDVVKSHLITPAGYGNATGMTEAEVKKLVDRAQFMEELLEFCQAPEQYHLARALRVDGPLGEFGRVLKKYDSRRDKQLVKRLMFANMVVQPEGDIARYVRDFGSVAGTDADADFKAAERQAMSELIEKMGPDALTREKASELRSDATLVNSFRRAGDRARETVRRVKLMDTPAKKSADCLSELEKVLPEMLCSAVGPGDLEYVLDQVGDDCSDIDYVDFSQTSHEAVGRSRPSSKLVACERLVESVVAEGRPVTVRCIFVRSIANLRRDLAAMARRRATTSCAGSSCATAGSCPSTP